MPDLNAQKTPSGEKVPDLGVGLIKTFTKRLAAAGLLVLAALPVTALTVSEAAAQDRTLKLHFTHTGERAVVTYKRNGKFDPRGLAQANQILRDFRKNEATRMDPRLFDLVWEVYRRSGATDYIHVVSAYRSPATNGMLRGRSRNSGVAKNSQHTLGKAMDFFIPGVKISTLRAIAMQMQVGGVGFYPKSGSPFVHLDVGGVRAWPRMTRQELVQIFPKGNTIHLPADGKPLPGYDQALADYKRRVSSDSIQVASTAGAGIRSDGGETRKQPNLLAFLFGGGGADEEEDNEESTAPALARRPAAPARPVPEPAPAPATVQVASAEPSQPENITAPVPLARPAFRSDAQSGGLATALYSPPRNSAQDALALQAAASANVPGANTEGFADLGSYKIPVPTMRSTDTGVMTASAGAMPAFDALTTVPVPAHRPATAMAAYAPVPSPKADDQQELTPALIAALSQDAEPLRASPSPVPAQRPVQTAALSPKVIQPSSKNMQFGDAFDAPKPAVTASLGAPAKVTKGTRAGKPSNEVTRSTALTGDLVAKWALNNNRADANASMKAPRVVSRTLNNDYAAGYSGGFKPVSSAAAIDPNRFSDKN